MSILIKGMEMPKKGCHHTLTIYADGTIAIGKSTDYKAVEIPTPHGRLIDVDAFFEDICNDLNDMTRIGIAVDGNWLWAKLDDALNNAQTIIEKEE